MKLYHSSCDQRSTVKRLLQNVYKHTKNVYEHKNNIRTHKGVKNEKQMFSFPLIVGS